MEILKFGGTSMGDDQTWRRVLQIINRYKQPFVIVSATERTTRKLLAAAKQALENIDEAHAAADSIGDRHRKLITEFADHYTQADSPAAQECNRWIDEQINELKGNLSRIYEYGELDARMKDNIASTGERLSSYLFAQCGSMAGFPTTWVDASEIMRTDSDFGQATPDLEFINQQSSSLRQIVDAGQIPVMGGYYGQDEQGQTTTLGFEGSDYTASVIGSALSAETIEIWTDVSGIYTCDPRIVENAKPIPQLSFQEATELAYFGAKVLHPSTTKPASKNEIPVRVKNIFEPDEPGTCISHQTSSDGRAKAMTFKKNCVIITITSAQTVMGYEFLAGVFDILQWHHLPVDVVTTTEASVSIAVENSHKLDDITEQLEAYGKVTVSKQQGVISLVGCAEIQEKPLISEILEHLDDERVNLISFSKSKGNLNIVLDNEQIIQSVQTIHKQIFE
jgi:aspartate kinase